MVKDKKIQKHAVTIVAVTTMIGGLNPAMTKVAIESMNPFLFMSLRFVLIGVIFMFMVRKFTFLRIKKVRRQLLLSSAIMFAYLPLFAIGIELSSALKASVLALTIPVFVYIFSVGMLHEPMVTRVLMGGIIALVGSLILIGLPVLLGERLELGDILLLGAYASVAAVVVHSKYLYTWVTPKELLSIRFTVAGLILLVYVLITSDLSTLATGTATAWWLLAYGVLISGVAANWLYYRGLRYIRAEDTAPIYYLDPLAGSLVAAWLLGERMEMSAVVGIVIILAGLLVAHPYHVQRYHRYNESAAQHHFRFLRRIASLARQRLAG